MFLVKNNVWPKGPEILMTRGDSGELDVGVTDENGEPYELQSGDVVTFKVKRSSRDPDDAAVITKTLGYGDDMVVELEPSDTAGLPLGEYYFFCRIVYASTSKPDTFIGGDSRYPGKLTLV